MGIPPIKELELAAKKIVWKAKEENSLGAFTQRRIRETVEKQFLLEPGTLGTSEYKDAIKAATKAAIDEDPPKIKIKPASKSPAKKKKSNGKAIEEESDEDLKATPKNTGKGRGKRVVQDHDYSGEDEPSPKKKPKVAPKPKSTPKPIKVGYENEEDEDKSEEKPKSKAKPPPKGKSKKIESESEDDEDDKEESKSKSPTNKKQKQKGSKEFKSLEHVPTSDMESDEPMANQVAGPSTSKAAPKSPAAVKPESENTPKKKVVSKPSSSKPGKVKDPESDSELSVLIDEPPKKKRKSASEKKTVKPQVKKSGKSSATSSKDKDEETIKRLKSLVVACGTRKVWSKVFQDLDTPQLQIKKLKEILADLGMTGRLSMEQAKAIKEKRELAKELEDVTEFAKKVASRPTATRRDGTKKSSADADESDSEKESDKNEDTDEEVAAPRKRMTARKSIMAFLEDQSEEE